MTSFTTKLTLDPALVSRNPTTESFVEARRRTSIRDLTLFEVLLIIADDETELDEIRGFVYELSANSHKYHQQWKVVEVRKKM